MDITGKELDALAEVSAKINVLRKALEKPTPKDGPFVQKTMIEVEEALDNFLSQEKFTEHFGK